MERWLFEMALQLKLKAKLIWLFHRVKVKKMLMISSLSHSTCWFGDGNNILSFSHKLTPANRSEDELNFV